MKPDNKSLQSNSPKNLLIYLDLGFRFALTIVVCFFGGYWLDKKLSTLPLFLILGALVGLAGGFLTVYRAVFPTNSKKDQQSNEGV